MLKIERTLYLIWNSRVQVYSGVWACSTGWRLAFPGLPPRALVS